VQTADSVAKLAEFGILAVRTKKNGEIRQLKHAVFGWIDAGTFGLLQEFKHFGPVISEFIEGGYRLKAAVWSQSIQLEVLGTGFNIPVGVILVVIALALYAADTNAGNKWAAFDLLCLLLPFGEVYLMWRGADWFLGAPGALNDLLTKLEGFTLTTGGTLAQGGTYYPADPFGTCATGYTAMVHPKGTTNLLGPTNQGGFMCVRNDQVAAFETQGWVVAPGGSTFFPPWPGSTTSTATPTGPVVTGNRGTGHT
jgi:hypothetical protein